MARVLLFSVFVSSHVLNPHAGTLDIEKYEVVKRDVADYEGQWWTLLFSDTLIEIPLLTTDGIFYDEDDVFGSVKGPDGFGAVIGPDGLQVRWLKENELVWVSWRTPPQGSGVYYDEAHIIEYVGGENPRELRRVNYPANGNQGAGNRQHLDINYTYDEERRLILEKLERHDTALFFHPFPLAEQLGETSQYLLEERWIQKSRFSLGPAGLRPHRPMLFLELGGREVSIEVVARFLILRLSPRFLQRTDVAAAADEITPSELARMVSSLQKSKNFDSQTQTLSGTISVPYVSGIAGKLRKPWEEEYVFRD